MSLKLNTASGGSITLQEADTASNLTLTVPAQAGSIVTADSSGNVGVGTDSPQRRLHVRELTTSADSGVRLEQSEGFVDLTTNGGHYRVSTGGSIRATVQSDGSQWSVIPSGTTLYQEFKCRAWANFDAVNLTIRGGGNFSSISRASTGVYSASFTTSMPDANYCAVGTSGGSGGATGDDSVVSFGAGANIGSVSGIAQIRTLINPSSSGRCDSQNLSIVVFR
jgi:hypothetical protein